MSYRTFVWVRANFVGFHRWKDAPAKVNYLRAYHRHVFNVQMAVRVGHDNRQVEFHTLKDELTLHLTETYLDQEFEFSCEQLAVRIGGHFARQGYSMSYVNVDEDGENGASVTFGADFKGGLE